MVEMNNSRNDFNFFVNEVIDNKRMFGVEAGLRHINELTKGLPVTTFSIRGKNWHGIPDREYERRLRKGLENAQNPSHVHFPLTGTKNIK